MGGRHSADDHVGSVVIICPEPVRGDVLHLLDAVEDVEIEPYPRQNALPYCVRMLRCVEPFADGRPLPSSCLLATHYCSHWEVFLESPEAAVLTRTPDICFAPHSGRRLGLAPFGKRTLSDHQTYDRVGWCWSCAWVSGSVMPADNQTVPLVPTRDAQIGRVWGDAGLSDMTTVTSLIFRRSLERKLSNKYNA